ncbi:MAG: hypothetical protein AAB865_02555 [Patescibacteria group bacterium]
MPLLFDIVVSFRFFVRDAIDNLAQLFWMSLVAVLVAAIGGSPAYAGVILGFEFMSVYYHHKEYHLETGWFTPIIYPIVGGSGFLLSYLWLMKSAVAEDRPEMMMVVMVVTVGSQIASISIHCVAHHRDWEIPRWKSVFGIAAGLALAIGGLFIYF